MKTFLEYVAEDLLQKHGNDLSHLAVVFPNKRASLFLNEHLAQLSGKPLWSPSYITISDLFRRHSQYTVADPIKLVCDLYRSFTHVTGIDETLDHFYGWGQLLVSDFDDLDKNMADADKVFANLRDIREMDDVSYLTPEQHEIIQRFFSNFSDDHNSKLKERFLRLWSKMGDIYHRFNSVLESQGLAYEGALYRKVATADELPTDFSHYAFVGFNMLQRVETTLFARLRREGKASFYWDFDDYYMHGSEAGHYICQYLSDFPNELDSSRADIYRNFEKPKSFTFVSAPTENIQARYVSTWLRQHRRYADGRKTAIVLCDETLLPAAIHALPDEVNKVNITTGYPLSQSPVASLLQQLFALQTVGYSISRSCFRLRQVCSLLRHPYINGLSPQIPPLIEKLSSERIYYPSFEQLQVDEATTLLLSTRQTNADILSWFSSVLQLVARLTDSSDPLFQESVFRAYTLSNRLHGLVLDGDLNVDTITLQRLLTQLMQTTTIPFHGEPVEGVQLMGVLETRNLDFDHVLLLSCNEGNMPKGVSDTSFIPYNLRKAYGLTTIDHKVSIFSYYFHRLLQRASDVTLLYNNATTDGHTGEMSRFMLQLMVENPHPIRFQTLHAGQQFTPFSPKTKELPSDFPPLHSRFSLLTPSAINRYMRCPLQFYYCYVEGLRELEDNDDDNIDNRIFGNIFHEAAQQLYCRLMSRTGKHITADALEQLLKQRVDIERAVDEAMEKELFQTSTSSPGKQDKPSRRTTSHPLNGLQIINRQVIIHYLRQLVKLDLHLTPFDIVGLEEEVAATMTIGSQEIRIGGRIDRIDKVGGQLRVIDYKTGSQRLQPLPDVASIFNPENIGKHSDYYLQTFVYASIVRNQWQLPTSPALLFIQHAAVDDYNPTLFLGRELVSDIATVQQEFRDGLTDIVTEIFDHSSPPPTATAASTALIACCALPNRKKWKKNDDSATISNHHTSNRQIKKKERKKNV